jgi:hypothetical protein
MPCYPALYFLYNERTFTEEECVVAGVGVLDHERIRQLFPSESIIRAETYLGMGKKVLDGAVDYSKLDFSKMGGKLILPEAPCDRRHASIQCSFSGVYVDEKEEKAILYLRLMLTSEYRYVYYFQKVGQLWLLKVREDCPAQ